MNAIIQDYNLFFLFIEKFLDNGFREIYKADPLILQLEKLTEANRQFYLVSDLIQLKILFSSGRCDAMTGVESGDLDPSVFIKSIHPDDFTRKKAVLTTLMNLGHKIFIENRGSAFISSNFRCKNPAGEYIDTLFQGYLFLSRIPCKTVFLFIVMTDISWFRKFTLNSHFYFGEDPSIFRYPDEKLLLMGNILLTSEFHSMN